MLLIYYFLNPVFWIIPWILQAFGYYKLLRKLDQDGRYGIIPFIGEWRLSKIYFEKIRTYWHALIMAVIYLAGGFYLRLSHSGGIGQAVGLILIVLASIVYGIFLIRLYWRIGKSFHKGILFRLALFIAPFIFLLILARDKAKFCGGPVFKRKIVRSRGFQIAGSVARELIFACEVVLIGGGVLFLLMKIYLPAPIVYMVKHDTHEKYKDVVGDGNIVDRAMTMGTDYAELDEMPVSRGQFFPDHSKDENVVVLEYIIGSNLEDMAGLASINMEQMQDATAAGENLKFVIQTGGSDRWFTSPIKNGTYGRYVIENGKVTEAMRLDDNMCMSDPNEIYQFLAWAKEKYPADRYMLVFWDHGGGLSSGYGQDALNTREDGHYGTIQVSEIANAINRSKMKFDVIGFDACLMQDVEIAYAMEPYADYYIASEETESGLGWFYTSAFAKLAEDPTIPTEEFAKELISSFDVYNTDKDTGNNGKSTLSLVDLTRIDPLFEKLTDFYKVQDAAIREGSAEFTDISLAARNAYTFTGNEQIDLIDYLEKLDDSDYDETVCPHEVLEELEKYTKAAVIYRNAAGNPGINGLAVTFPIEAIDAYKYDVVQYKYFGMKDALKFHSDFFSIIANAYLDESDTVELFGIPIDIKKPDYTTEDWYVEGFEDYVEVLSVDNIPLEETEYGWKIGLSEDIWNIIADAKQIVYQKTDDGWKYLGQDVPGLRDEDDHPMISNDGYWIHVNNEVVCYEAESSYKTEDGSVVYTGSTKAVLNGADVIVIEIEWDPVTEESGGNVQGHILGYHTLDDNSYMEKGLRELQYGESIQFLFDFYDDDGNLIKTEQDGRKIRITGQNFLTVSDRKLNECDVSYGIIMTDAFSRTFVTDMVQEHITR